MKKMSRIVLGGGISGLSTAFYLSKKINNRIALYEASERLGGWIRTRETENGSFFEQGARTLRYGNIASENALELVEEIGLSSSVKFVGPGFKQRYFYVNNKLCNLPNTVSALFKKNSLFDEPLLYPIIRDILGSRKKLHDESVYDFIFRRFGKKYADVFSGIICGVYAGSAREISIKAAMGPIFDKEQRYGSVILGFLLDSLLFNKKGKRTSKEENRKVRGAGAWSFDKGMETLPKALSEYLKDKGNTDIYLNKRCNRIEFKEDKIILDIEGNTEVAEHLYSTLPSRELCKLIDDKHKYLKEQLSKIPFVSVAVINLEYEGNILPMDAFGFLVPPNQNLPILGVIFDSCIYPQDNKTVLTVMMGGRWFEQYFGKNPESDYILKIATEQLRKILNVDDKPINYLVSILNDCIPQYIVGHTDTVQRINSYIAERKLPLTLIGNSFNGVGIPDSILSARIGVELQPN